MLMQLSEKGFVAGRDLRNDVEDRIYETLLRFESRIDRVKIFLADENGPRNGNDKSLRVVVVRDRLPQIVIEEKGSDWGILLSHVAERTFHAVSRQIERSRTLSDRTKMSGTIGTHHPDLDIVPVV